MNAPAPFILGSAELAAHPTTDELTVPPRSRYGDLDCPHCLFPTTRRSSKTTTTTYREAYYVCQNAACGHTFKGSSQYLYGLSPSAIPNPELDLPLRPMERIMGQTVRETTGPPDPDQPGLFDL